MPSLNSVVALIVVGVLLYMVNHYIAVNSKIKSILNGVVLIAVVLRLLSVFGIVGFMSDMHMGN